MLEEFTRAGVLAWSLGDLDLSILLGTGCLLKTSPTPSLSAMLTDPAHPEASFSVFPLSAPDVGPPPPHPTTPPPPAPEPSPPKSKKNSHQGWRTLSPPAPTHRDIAFPPWCPTDAPEVVDLPWRPDVHTPSVAAYPSSQDALMNNVMPQETMDATHVPLASFGDILVSPIGRSGAVPHSEISRSLICPSSDVPFPPPSVSLLPLLALED